MSQESNTISHGKKGQPHALLFPYPGQGHINPMMQLAKRLLEAGFFITFVNTEYNHQLMFPKGVIKQELCLPNLQFEQIADGLPPEHMRFNDKNGGVVEMTVAILALPGPFAELVRRIMSGGVCPPLTCIIADAFCSWMQDVADQFRLPRVSLWTSGVHANLACIFQSTLASHGLIPVTDGSKLVDEVNVIDGISPMKLEDYISFFLVKSSADFIYQWYLRVGMKRTKDALWNLGNNVEEIETEAMNAFKQEVPTFLPIGPLLPPHVIRGTADPLATTMADITSLWPEDLACYNWLSHHDKASVIYISFGSIVNLTEEDLENFILGLEKSGSPFLWAIRHDQGGVALTKLRSRLDIEAAKGKPSHHALIVTWAPQLAILMHPSIGLFISHCGWNSVIESLAAGVPILAKAGDFADQRMNAHYVAEVWKVGLRLPTLATASIVESSICTLLGNNPSALKVREHVKEVRHSILDAMSLNSGSSYTNLHMFIDDMYKRATISC